MQSKWYETFFHGVVLECWARVVTPEQTSAEADFIVATIEPPAGGRLLDVPCGNGRHSLELASRGYHATGIDISEEWITEARAQAATRGLPADFQLGDMFALAEMADFDGAFCFGNSLGYLDHAGLGRFAAAIARALKPGARFVAEFGVAAESILPALQPRRWYQVGDILMLSSQKYDAAESRLDTEYTFIQNGKTDTRPCTYWIHTVAEIRRVLDQAGLPSESLFGSFERAPYEVGSPSLVLVARRR